MKNFEQTNSFRAQFDYVLQDEELREVLVDDLLASKQNVSDIIDPSKELSNDVMLLWIFSGHLAAVLGREGEDMAEVQRVIYRGVSFGLQLVNELKSTPIHQLAISEFFQTPDHTSYGQIITEQSAYYLEQNPHLHSLVNVFLTDLDPTYDHHHHAKTAAALLCMLCEREHALAVQIDEMGT